VPRPLLRSDSSLARPSLSPLIPTAFLFLPHHPVSASSPHLRLLLRLNGTFSPSFVLPAALPSSPDTPTDPTYVPADRSDLRARRPIRPTCGPFDLRPTDTSTYCRRCASHPTLLLPGLPQIPTYVPPTPPRSIHLPEPYPVNATPTFLLASFPSHSATRPRSAPWTPAYEQCPRLPPLE
jgi:hypothetical protein